MKSTRVNSAYLTTHRFLRHFQKVFFFPSSTISLLCNHVAQWYFSLFYNFRNRIKCKRPKKKIDYLFSVNSRPEFDRPPKCWATTSGPFGFFFLPGNERRSVLCTVGECLEYAICSKMMNSTRWAVMGDETWHYLLFLFLPAAPFDLLRRQKSFAEAPRAQLVHCVVITGIKEKGFDRSSWAREKWPFFLLRICWLQYLVCLFWLFFSFLFILYLCL